ncbi:helix-turn-helix domain-containing protein [Arthrobacter sp. 2MCAF14]|uniref:helix-turn-helix domain-containing protein n=1 Tax=Arthrobacter sp. 2MCAF14 TaxID=3232982 RepID=UPI003F8F56E0
MDYDLRRLRTLTGVSQAELARLAGVSRSTLSAFELGQRTPSPAIAERVLSELRRPSLTLFGHRKALQQLARKYGFHNVSVFGSCARGEDGPNSDVDLLLDGSGITLFDIAEFIQDASELLGGIRVDVVISGGIGAAMDRIVAEAVPL